MLWNVLAFHNLTGLKELSLHRCESLPLHYLQMLSSLRELAISCSSNAFPFTEADSHAKYQFPIESLVIRECNDSGKELTQLFLCFPKLSNLLLWGCEKVTGLVVNVRGQHATEISGPSSLAKKVEQKQGARVEDGIIVTSEEVEHSLLLLPPQLQELSICDGLELSLLQSSPHGESNKEDGRTGARGGLHGLPETPCYLWSGGPVGPVSLSNLTALTSLLIYDCGDLRGEGLLSLLAQGHLTYLSVIGTPNFFADSEPSQVHEQELPPRSSKLQGLKIDDVARFTAAPIHRSLLFSSLTKLEISKDNKVEHFTDQQEALLFVNSLEDITFLDCDNLQSLPKRLHGLPNLKRLCIWESEAIQMLPKDGLPSSLQELIIRKCRRIQSPPKDCLPDSLQRLEIQDCPAIWSLPDVDDLPSSLREIDVLGSESEELRAHCRKLINIIPIVRVWPQLEASG